MKELKTVAKHNAQRLKQYLEKNEGKFPIRVLLARFGIQEGFRAKTVQKYYAYLRDRG